MLLRVLACQHVDNQLILYIALFQAKKVAAKLKKFGIKKIFISPFYRYVHADKPNLIEEAELMPVICRCLQTASFAAEGLGIQPQDWTVTCAVGEVSKGLKSTVHLKDDLDMGNANNTIWKIACICHVHMPLPSQPM